MLSKQEEIKLMQNLWNIEHQKLLERLKKDIVSGPTSTIPDPFIMFYIKTDWPKDGMGVQK